MKPTTFKIIDKGKIIIALVFLLLAFCFQSCKKYLEIPAPKSSLVTATVFGNDATATSAQLNIYVQMWQNAESYSISANMGDYSDELTNYSTNLTQVQLYTNALLVPVVDNTIVNLGHYYNYIYQANAVINGLQNTRGCSPAVKQQLTGEAYFIRAFWHFYLTNIYGAVPVALTTDYNVTSKLARSPRTAVLQQVIADLRTAQGMLNANYVDGSDTIVTTERVRPTKAAALALMARAYLYLGDYANGNSQDYQKADSAATAVISNSVYSLAPLANVFLANNSEAIWQLQTPSDQGTDTQDASKYILLAAPYSGTQIAQCNTASPQLLNAFEAGDQRKAAWIGSVTPGTVTYAFPYKYKNYIYAGTEYEVVLRLGEQYLIRAEARVHEGNIPGALADLNTIRTRAGLTNYSGAQDAASVLVAILHERQVELFSEWGHRWFDLQRAFASKLPVNAVTVMGGTNGVCQAKGGVWNPDNYQLLFPIPLSDLSADINLTQNTGY